MSPKLTETIYVDFVTSSPATGAAVDADSTPTAEVFEDATDTSILSPTVTKRTGKTGQYRVPVACTSANGFEAQKCYNVVVSATVGAVAAKAVVSTFQLHTNDQDDIATAILTRSSQTSVDAIAAKTTNLPADPADASDIAAQFATVNTTLTTLSGYVDTEVAAIKSKTDNLPSDPADASDIAANFVTLNGKVDTVAGYIDTEVGAIKSKTDQLNFAGTDVKATLDFETVTVAVNNDKTGYALTSAYDAAKTAASQASVDAVKAVVDAIKLIDDKLNTMVELDGAVWRYTTNALEQAPAGGGGTVIDNNAIADALLKRDWTLVSGEALYSLLNAARMLRNVWSTAGGTLTIKKEDGSTTAWSRALTTDPAAEPITGAT